MAAERPAFDAVHERLHEIVDEVSAEDISLDDALKLYEEAVKLGLSACDLSEQDVEAFLTSAEAEAAAAADGEGAAGSAEDAGPAETPAAEAAPGGADAAVVATATGEGAEE